MIASEDLEAILSELNKKEEMTKVSLAEMLGVHYVTIYRYIKGEYRKGRNYSLFNPSIHRVVATNDFKLIREIFEKDECR